MKKLVCGLFALAMLWSCTPKETVIGFEPGEFTVMVGPSSEDARLLVKNFNVIARK
jgi:hypothetical protein